MKAGLLILLGALAAVAQIHAPELKLKESALSVDQARGIRFGNAQRLLEQTGRTI